MPEHGKSFSDWLSIKSEFDFTKSKFLGGLLGFLALGAALLLLCIFVVGLVLLTLTMVGVGPYSSDNSGAAIRNLGLVIAAIVGTPFLVWRSFVAQQSANLSEQSQITDRINIAVQGLGSEKLVKRIIEKPRYKKSDDGEWEKNEDGSPVPARRPDGKPIVDREQLEETQANIEVRVGSILSLERIARDSKRDRDHILDILCTYIRENAREAPRGTSVREDLQAALDLVIFRRQQFGAIDYAPNLRGADLSHTLASGADFTGTQLQATSWRSASLNRASFSGTVLDGSIDFSGADLEGADFNHTTISGIEFTSDTNLTDATFENASLSSVKFESGPKSFEGSSICGCNFRRVSFRNASFRNTTLDSNHFDGTAFFEVTFDDAKFDSEHALHQTFGIREGFGATSLPEGVVVPPQWIDLSAVKTHWHAKAIFSRINSELNRFYFSFEGENAVALVREWEQELSQQT